MIKWPWKASDTTDKAELPWAQALAIPLLANLTHDEQAKLVQLGERFLQQKRLTDASLKRMTVKIFIFHVCSMVQLRKQRLTLQRLLLI